MAGIRGKNTKPEIYIRSLLRRHGFRFRVHVDSLPSKPDIILKCYRSIISVHMAASGMQTIATCLNNPQQDRSSGVTKSKEPEKVIAWVTGDIPECEITGRE